jgi:translation elongation factor EF-G
MPSDFVPIVEISIGLATGVDRSMLQSMLAKLAADDDQFKSTDGANPDQLIVSGIDEIQLAQKTADLRLALGADITIGRPQVAFRETITCRAEGHYTHKKQSSGAGEFAGVKVVLEPQSPDTGSVCHVDISDTSLSSDYKEGIKAGIETALRHGVVQGFPVIGVAVRLIDGRYHDADSNAVAFAIAATAAVREALAKGSPVVLEPVVKVTIVTPSDCIDRIADDLNLRHGNIVAREERDGRLVLTATAPAMNLFGYMNALRSISNGRATYTIQFDHYAPLPAPDDPPFRPAVGMRA